MATIELLTTDNKSAGSVELSAAIFEVPVKPGLLHAEVRRQLAARRAGTASTKNRNAVSGGGAKPYRQKGTGRARQGSIRAPQYQGGGVVFGPVPRNYAHKLPKKVRRAALCSALSLRREEGDLAVVDSISLEACKTKHAIELLKGLGMAGTSVLIVLDEPDETLERAARNIPGVDVLLASGLNVYDVLGHKKLLLTRAALEAVTARLRTEGSA
ncbi:MAG: 50S ribosomal protein L4 [Myxococcales bacterium]|nr:50S ribosomal protein L4 [Myxococcales bacterium]